jgi:hypothetical protein
MRLRSGIVDKDKHATAKRTFKEGCISKHCDAHARGLPTTPGHCDRDEQGEDVSGKTQDTEKSPSGNEEAAAVGHRALDSSPRLNYTTDGT